MRHMLQFFKFSLGPVVGIVLSLCMVSQAFAFKILVWGDSLSAAYGMPREQGWVALLSQHLEGSGIEVTNGSKSGETTSGGLRRLPRAINETAPDLIILELGANDGLYGLDLDTARFNLVSMIDSAQTIDADVLLLGMRIPSNYGRAYTRQFERIYSDLEQRQDIEVLPFFLEPVAMNYDLMQPDGIHPTADAQPILLRHVWPQLAKLLPSGMISEIGEPKL